MMNPAEYANIAKCEKEFWWYRGMDRILDGMLAPVMSARSPGIALETGCGTGYNATQLEQRYGWRSFSTDLQHEGLMYGIGKGVQRMAKADIAALPFADGRFDAVIS